MWRNLSAKALWRRNLLIGGAGDDTLDGGAGDDVLVGSANIEDSDTFVLSSGNDVIKNFNAGADTLKLDAAALGIDAETFDLSEHAHVAGRKLFIDFGDAGEIKMIFDEMIDVSQITYDFI